MNQLQKECSGCSYVYSGISKCFRLFVVLLALSFLTGCGAMQGKFATREEANISLFADHTIALMSTLDFGINKGSFLTTREYFDSNEPAAVKLIENKMIISQVFNNIIRYSIDIVTLSESDMTEVEKINKYANLLETFRFKALQKIGVRKEDFSEILPRIREQEEMLGAFREAQPLINAGIRYAAEIIFENDTLGLELVRDMESRIDDDYAYANDFIEDLQNQKLLILKGLEMLYSLQAGDRNAIKELRQNPWIRSKEILKKDKLDGAKIQALEKQLFDHMSKLDKIEKQLADDIEHYLEAHKELDMIFNKTLKGNSNARLALVIWGRAHQKMAAGTLATAEWFDFSETPDLLLKIGTNAL